MSLPRNSVIAVVVTGTAVASLAFVWARAEHRARSHALTHVVRFPAKVAVGATLDALRSRVVGTARALWHRVWPSSASEATDEPEHEDDEYFWHVDAYARDVMDAMPESQPIA